MDRELAFIILFFGFAFGVGATLIVQGIFYDYNEVREKKKPTPSTTDKIQDELDQSIGG